MSLTAPTRARPRPRVSVRPCLVCGLVPGNHGIATLSCRLSRSQRVGQDVSSTTPVVLCAVCLREAVRDGRLRQAIGDPTPTS